MVLVDVGNKPLDVARVIDLSVVRQVEGSQ